MFTETQAREAGHAAAVAAIIAHADADARRLQRIVRALRR